MADAAFVGSRAKLKELTHQLAAVLSGAHDRHGVAQGFMLTIGVAALSDIRLAFEVKARGGTDAMGIKWPPLSPKTIANRRVGPRDIARDSDIKEREKIRKREFRRLFKRLQLSLPADEARRRANQLAGQIATRETGRTKIDVLGNRVVEILRDTGVLFNSLGPGLLTESGGVWTYSKPAADGGDSQVLVVNAGKIIVGTNVIYAGTHDRGDPARNIPRRQIFPEDEDQVPAEWWDNWLDAASLALRKGMTLLVEAESR